MGEGEIFIFTGEVFVTKYKVKLRTDGVGSCVVVVVYDKEEGIGGLAHTMLAGSSPHKNKDYDTRYAEDALEIMFYRMKRLGANQIEACLVGGANVLDDMQDTICYSNINSIKNILANNKIKIVAERTGGKIFRSVCLDILQAKVYFYEGSSEAQLLYKWE